MASATITVTFATAPNDVKLLVVTRDRGSKNAEKVDRNTMAHSADKLQWTFDDALPAGAAENKIALRILAKYPGGRRVYFALPPRTTT